MVKVDERRQRPLPPFEAVEAQLRQLMLQQRFVADIESLRAGADVEILVQPPVPPTAPPAEGQPDAPADGAPAQ